MKTTSMLAALTAILAAGTFSDPSRAGTGLADPFTVTPVPREDWDNYIENAGLRIDPGYFHVPKEQIGVFDVVGGGETSLGLIYHICDSGGNNVATYYST